jgi:hypothetical protein
MFRNDPFHGEQRFTVRVQTKVMTRYTPKPSPGLQDT